MDPDQLVSTDASCYDNRVLDNYCFQKIINPNSAGQGLRNAYLGTVNGPVPNHFYFKAYSK